MAHNVAYGPDPRQTLDIYAPAGGVKDARTIVFVYGGSWNSGNKEDYSFAAKAFASRGFVTAVFDYRLVPQVRYPAFVEDSAAAVAFVYRHAPAYGGDPKRLYLVGHSAGAYNAMMVALAPRFLAGQGLSNTIIRAVAGLSGPYDFLPLDVDATRRAFGGVSDLKSTQPLNQVLKGRFAPPVLLATGDADDLVYPRNTVALAARLRSTGHEVEERHYPGVDHKGTLLSISRPLRGRAPVLEDIIAFFDAH
ncbi:alpha/beta hydrolase [Mesorhizobium sp. PAMC28654]|uniref:alpha/beta hydrolase n=1 Tax=Mesorhizobium sp. PAMC28654 TaxID=2880934 RepID=UPI001D0ADC57|nr:alpha/beta hydrolase [Mesorhizobium sp. PAMC28654]UDL87778.1 alpha/beta hydrolase [Mesorhizobium sp. PAMC28654]